MRQTYNLSVIVKETKCECPRNFFINSGNPFNVDCGTIKSDWHRKKNKYNVKMNKNIANKRHLTIFYVTYSMWKRYDDD